MLPAASPRTWIENVFAHERERAVERGSAAQVERTDVGRRSVQETELPRAAVRRCLCSRLPPEREREREVCRLRPGTGAFSGRNAQGFRCTRSSTPPGIGPFGERTACTPSLSPDYRCGGAIKLPEIRAPS